MNPFLRHILFFIVLFCGLSISMSAQKNIQRAIADSLSAIANDNVFVGRVNVIDFQANTDSKTLIINADERLGYISLRPQTVKRIYDAIRKITFSRYPDYTIQCLIEKKNIENFVPNSFRTENLDTFRQFRLPELNRILVQNTSRPFPIESGLEGRHIALWHSHGWYFNQRQNRWEWQRPRIFQTVEDIYTMSYTIPYLAPMLENAGANVFFPRERDTQTTEVIVDNDMRKGNSKYFEYNERISWMTGIGQGFNHPLTNYLQGDNPFTMGSFRQAKAVGQVYETSRTEWLPNLPKSAKYAVYVSYKTLEKSASDAHYTVYHSGGKTNFVVDQTMAGGTWVYLGSFDFKEGISDESKVVLTNFSKESNKIISADAVKFGGGMGNIARSPYKIEFSSLGVLSDSVTFPPYLQKIRSIFDSEVSRYPRYAEAARYWLQWAGMPLEVYSPNKGSNDYTDDLQSRALWVNYLAGGSVVSPKTKGLGVPLDLSFALHSDAGATSNDSVIGSLGIYSLRSSNQSMFFGNGVSRWASRDLADIILAQIIDDSRKQFNADWTGRGLWDKSYNESRVPEVPSMILELLSHQNFADMRYGLDPKFRFMVSRAIYKGILKYLASVYQKKYIVQPLPVSHFSCEFSEKNKLNLNWKAVLDSLEPTAVPRSYVVYTRMNDGGFDNGRLVENTSMEMELQTGIIYSFKVTAVNAGGESFPSEILSACQANSDDCKVLIVNGFTRISAPESFENDSTSAGFMNDKAAGVPYLSDISYTGNQFQFKRGKAWSDNDAPGFGASHANLETRVIAGNSFDYPYLHGKAIASAGFSFVSTSSAAVEIGKVNLKNYKIVDLILGKQKQTKRGNGQNPLEFKTFPLALQEKITNYCNQGGNLLVSGAYVLSDMSEDDASTKMDKQFVAQVLRCRLISSQASVEGDVRMVGSKIKSFSNVEFSFFTQPNSIAYSVESSDAIAPVGSSAETICRYSESNSGAAVAYNGNYKVCTFGFPLEAIKSESVREKIMAELLQFLNSKK